MLLFEGGPWGSISGLAKHRLEAAKTSLKMATAKIVSCVADVSGSFFRATTMRTRMTVSSHCGTPRDGRPHARPIPDRLTAMSF